MVSTSSSNNTPDTPTAGPSIPHGADIKFLDQLWAAYREGYRSRDNPGTTTLTITEGMKPEHINQLNVAYCQGVRARDQEVPSSTSTTTVTKVAKIADPDYFHGEREKLRPFQSQCKLKLAGNAHMFPTEASKMSYVAGRCRGIAYDWLESYIRTGLIESFTDYEGMRKAMELAFGDPDAQKTAERELYKLRQGDRTCAAYHAEFQRITANLEWDEHALCHAFRSKLNDALKDMLMFEDAPEDMEDLVKLCIKLDNRYRARQEEKKGRNYFFKQRALWQNNKASTSNSNGSTSATQSNGKNSSNSGNMKKTNLTPGYYGPAPMELDSTDRRPIGTEEMEKRKKDGSCFNCGKKGHFAKDCRGKKQKGKPRPQLAELTSTEGSQNSGNGDAQK